MRVMVDTNVLISAFIFRGQRMNTLMYKITSEHQLVLASYVVEELKTVVNRKFPGKAGELDIFLSQIPYELLYTPQQPRQGLFEIRDAEDYPILYTAIAESVDVFVSGDRDFESVQIDMPEILTPAGFLDKY